MNRASAPRGSHQISPAWLVAMEGEVAWGAVTVAILTIDASQGKPDCGNPQWLILCLNRYIPTIASGDQHKPDNEEAS
ncbi:hypothetical protein MASR1M60_17490 [Rhodocyclaceae bacterium]